MKILFCTLLALGGILPGPALAQADAPPLVRGFVNAFNAGNAVAISSYLDAHVAKAPPGMGDGGDQTQELVRLRSLIGPVKIEDVRDLPRRITATVRAKRGSYRFLFMKAPPGSGAQEFIGVSAGLAPPPMSHTQSAAQYFTSISAAGFFSGAALVARQGTAPFVGAYGVANREKHIPNSSETLFDVASIGKLFTTAAIYQLIESGKLR